MPTTHKYRKGVFQLTYWDKMDRNVMSWFDFLKERGIATAIVRNPVDKFSVWRECGPLTTIPDRYENNYVIIVEANSFRGFIEKTD